MPVDRSIREYSWNDVLELIKKDVGSNDVVYEPIGDFMAPGNNKTHVIRVNYNYRVTNANSTQTESRSQEEYQESYEEERIRHPG